MTPIRSKLTHTIIVWAAALFICLPLALHFLLPHVVKTQGVRRMILSRAAEAYSGEIAFGEIRPALLPWPHAVVTQGRLSDGDRLDLQIPKVAVYLKIWPLLTGKLRIDRIKLIKPRGKLDVGLIHGPGSEKREPQPSDRSTGGAARILAPVIGLLGIFEAKIVDGSLDLQLDGRTIIAVSQLTGRIAADHGQFHLGMNGRTSLDRGFRLEAVTDMSTLNGSGHLVVTGLQSRSLRQVFGFGPEANDLPQAVVNLDVDLRFYGLERFRAHFSAKAPIVQLDRGDRQLILRDLVIDGHAGWTGRQLDVTVSRSRAASPPMQWAGSFSWAKDPPLAKMPIHISLQGAGLVISPIRDALLKLFGDQPVLKKVLAIVRDGKIPTWTMGVSASDWQALKKMAHLEVECRLTEGRIVVPNDLFDLNQVSGQVVIAGGRLDAHGVSARQGNTFARNGALTLGLYDGSRAFALDTYLDADAAEIPVALRKLIQNQDTLAQLDRLPPFTGRASGRLTVGDSLDRLSAEVTAKARLNTGNSVLDIIGTAKDLPGDQTSVRVFIKGRMGAETVDWLKRTGAVPTGISLRSPFGIAGADIAWAPPGRMRLNGLFEWDDGPRVGAALSSSEGVIHLQQLRVEDAASDAVISLRSGRAGRLWDIGFAGHLEKSTVDGLLEDHQLQSGAMKGRFRVHYDRDDPGQSILDGALSIKDVGYLFEDVGAIRVIEASISGQGRRIALPQALVTWDDSTLSFAGSGVITRQAVDLRGNLKADTLNTQKVMAVFGQDKPGTPDGPGPEKDRGLTVRGKVSVEVDQLVHDRYRFVPMYATVEFKDQLTLIDVTRAELCGIQMPGRIELYDGMARLAFAPHAEQSALDDASSCLSDRQSSEKMLGVVNLDGQFTTQGRHREEFLSNLKGGVRFNIEQGRISNVGSAGLFTNLLSYLSVNQYIQGDLPDLRKNDFAYNRIESQWVFGDGYLRIKEGVMKSNSVNMVADGRYHLLSKELDLVVLVSPLTTVDWIVDRIPIVGDILQGTLVAIPVRIKGPGADPKVLPLSPKAVGARLGGILKRTLKTPVRIIEPLLKNDDEQPPKQGDD